jgi:hypothetical protein
VKRYSLFTFYSSLDLSSYFSQSINKSTEKRFDELPEYLMVEVYTEPLYKLSQSTTGGFKYRTFKRQRIKFYISYSSIDPNN